MASSPANLLEEKKVVTCTRKDFTSPYSWIGLGHQHGPYFIVSGILLAAIFSLSVRWVFSPEHECIRAVWMKMSWDEMSTASMSRPNPTQVWNVSPHNLYLISRGLNRLLAVPIYVCGVMLKKLNNTFLKSLEGYGKAFLVDAIRCS